MPKRMGAPIASYFADLTDPRSTRRRQHHLLDIITIAICASICGADNWVDVALFGRAKQVWFTSFLELPYGIPSHDTFGRVFVRLNPERFQECFLSWTRAVAQLTQGALVSLEASNGSRGGKT